jgi:hypothetical protein
MSLLDKIRSNSPINKNNELILKAFGFEKSRTGVYSDNSQNRRLKRVGQKYGSKKQEEVPSPEKNKKEETKVTEKKFDEKKVSTFAKKATTEQLEAYIKYNKATPEIKKIAKLELESRNKSEDELHDHARKSSQQDLENTIKTHTDEKVRKVAHKEISRRGKEEAIQEKEPERKDEKKPEVKKDKSPKDSIEDSVKDLSDKYKGKMQELMKDENIGNDEILSKLSKESQDISRYIQRVKQFEDVDKEREIKNVGKFLGLNDENEIQKFFGDGTIISIEKSGNAVAVLTEDCYIEREFEEGIVHMDEFLLNPDIEKSKGKGTEIFSNQIKGFKDKGYKELITDAAKSNIYNGYYTWARLGYDIQGNESKTRFKKLIKDSNDDDIKDIQSLPELMSFEKGRKFWKDNGFQFQAEFRLDDNSESMFILNEYIKDKQNGKEKTKS